MGNFKMVREKQYVVSTPKAHGNTTIQCKYHGAIFYMTKIIFTFSRISIDRFDTFLFSAELEMRKSVLHTMFYRPINFMQKIKYFSEE